LDDGAILARFSISGPTGALCNVKVEGGIAYAVTFDEGGPAHGNPLIQTLDKLGKSVGGILERFKALP
jgi:hypothetical protein